MLRPPSLSPRDGGLFLPPVKPLLIAAAGRTISSVPLGRRDEDVEVRRVPVLPTAVTLDATRPTVIVLDRSLIASSGTDPEHIRQLAKRAALVAIGDAGETEPGDDFPGDLLVGYLPANADPATIIAMLRGAFRSAAAIVAERRALAEGEERRRELADLTRVGAALSTQRDLLTLLDMILTQARRITRSDAGSIYITERPEPGEQPKALRFKLAQNFTLPALPLKESTVAIDHASLAGYTAATGEPLVIADVYLLPDDVSYKQNRSFDEKIGYRTKSMLVIPMKTHRDEIIGVLQLINRKRHEDN